MPNVVREMVRRGYSDVEIEKVLGLNLMRAYRKVRKRKDKHGGSGVNAPARRIFEAAAPRNSARGRSAITYFASRQLSPAPTSTTIGTSIG